MNTKIGGTGRERNAIPGFLAAGVTPEITHAKTSLVVYLFRILPNLSDMSKRVVR
jgi:hypothetical protein